MRAENDNEDDLENKNGQTKQKVVRRKAVPVKSAIDEFYKQVR